VGVNVEVWMGGEREYELQDLRAEQGLVQGMDALPVQVSVGAGLWV
jgi:hypothetical protein